MKNVFLKKPILSISTILGVCLVAISVFLIACKKDEDQFGLQVKEREITSRSGSIDTTYILGTNFTLVSTSPSEVEYTLNGDWEWKDNNGGTTWNPLSTGAKVKVKCICTGVEGTCRIAVVNNLDGTNLVSCWIQIDECSGECALYVKAGVANIPNGITVRPR